MKTVLCFGDSNTYGYMAGIGTRFPRDIRWPGALQNLLGDEYYVIEEGLSGRTTVYHWDDNPWKDAVSHVKPIVASHVPLDIIIIMLGTNDCHKCFNSTLEGMEKGISDVARMAREVCIENQGYSPEIILVAPPPIADDYSSSPFLDNLDDEGVRKSKEVPVMQKRVADRNGYLFLDAGKIVKVSDTDAMHLDAWAHKALAEKLAEIIKDIK